MAKSEISNNLVVNKYINSVKTSLLLNINLCIQQFQPHIIMEHIRQFDWCYSQPDIYFVKEADLDHCVTERILRNKFHDPLISSDSEEDQPTINWDQVFSKTQNLEKLHRIFVPCLLPLPQYPKQSALTDRHHFQCIKVLSAQNMHVLEQEFVPRPTKNDYKVFEELKPIYEKEQKEYIEWAKTMWTTSHCLRALRPKPIIEAVYEALFKLKVHEMQCFPSNYELVAQIPLDTRNSTFDMQLEEDLINVDLKLLPKIDNISLTKKLSIMKTCSVPEPCKKHPCRFILPNEKSVSRLPLTAVYGELAQYALERGASCVASESALRCLAEPQRAWDLAVAVHPAVAPDGERVNILVLGDEFSVNKESPLIRTYTSFKHMLEQALILPSEKLNYSLGAEDISDEETNNSMFSDMDVTSDDEGNGLCIDDSDINDLDSDPRDNNKNRTEDNEITSSREKRGHIYDDDEEEDDGFEKCTCKDTIFERPPRRSFRKWKITNKTTEESFSVLIHCAHRAQNKQGEVLLEPSPEYQLELGASEMSEGRLRSLALAMHLRKNATLAHFRINACSGDVATVEHTGAEAFRRQHGGVMSDVTNYVHSALTQLQGLMPGSYVLRHEATHGANALLYVGAAGGATRLRGGAAAADDALLTTTPPTLGPALLPYHKFRRMLPCAFTPHARQMRRAPPPRAPPRAPPRHRTPPRALQWPKKKKRKKAKN